MARTDPRYPVKLSCCGGMYAHRAGCRNAGPLTVPMAHPDPELARDDRAYGPSPETLAAEELLDDLAAPWTDEDTAELAEEMSLAGARIGARWADALGMAAAWRAGMADGWRGPFTVLGLSYAVDGVAYRAHDLGLVPMNGGSAAYGVAARDNADRWAGIWSSPRLPAIR